MKKTRSIARSLLSVSGVVILVKLLGFIKQVISADLFGATIRTDLISISEGLITNMDYLLVQALSTAFIPTYLAVTAEEGEKGKRFISDCIKSVFLIALTVSVAVFAASPLIARILAPSYSGEVSAQLAKYIRILAPVFIAVTELALFNSLLKANKIFVPGELIGFNQSVIFIILAFTIGKRVGPDTLIIAFITYAVFNLLFLSLYSRELWSIRGGNPFRSEDVRRLLRMMGPLILGYSLVFVNQQVDKIIVSGLGDGVVTAMAYAAVLSNFVTTFVGSLCGVIFTYVTQHIVNKENDRAAELLTGSGIQMVTLLLPVSILAVLNASDIVTIVFARGKFDQTAVGNCAYALVGYGMMFVPAALRDLFSRFQYGYGDSRRPMINSSISIVVNIGLSILLSRFWGVLGVTVATSFSVLICAVLNVISSRRHNDRLDFRPALKCLPRWLLGAVLCVAVTFLGRRGLSGIRPLFRFAGIVLVSFAGYAAVNLPLLKPLLKKLRRR